MGISEMVQNAMVGQGTLKHRIEKAFRSERVTLPLLKGGKLRASEFGRVCPRQEVLCALNDVTRKREETADSSMTFLHGTALHWGLQNELLPDIDVILGIWQCMECGVKYGSQENTPHNFIKRPNACSCGSAEFLYREANYHNEEYDIGGHPDGFLVIPPLKGVGIIEIKSIALGWSVKQCPMIGHVIQCQIYMWLTGLYWAKILYWDKMNAGTDAIIEYHVERCPSTIETIQQEIKSIWNGLKGGVLPPRTCEIKTAPRAKGCPVAEKCFDDLNGIEIAP